MMWIYSYHRFLDEAAFAAACLAAGFPLDVGGHPSDPLSVAADVIGVLPSDAGWHVNMAWFERDVPSAFVASQIHPSSPNRMFAAVAEPEPVPLADAIATAIGRIRAEFDAHINAGIVWGGRPLQIDDDSTARMAAVVVQTLVGAPLPAGFAWRMGDNTYLPIDAAGVHVMAATAAGRVMALRAALWAAVDAARAATTNAEAEGVTARWPGA